MSSSGYLLPLKEFLMQDRALSTRIAGHLTENTVILEDNDIEHRLNEAIPYKAVTEEVANGILVSSLPLFERAEFSGDVFLGVVGNSTRQETILQFIDYLTSEATGGMA